LKGDHRDFSINSVVVEFESSGDSADGLPDPVGIHTRSYGFDNSGSLVTVPGWRDWSFQILAIAEHNLGAVESESFDPETDFPWARFRHWQFIKLEHFGGPGLVEANNLYGTRHAYLANIC
jgi:hypothetical protein